MTLRITVFRQRRRYMAQAWGKCNRENDGLMIFCTTGDNSFIADDAFCHGS
jgi:hypothetical protein